MLTKSLSCRLVAGLFVVSYSAHLARAAGPLAIWRDRPAQKWEEALPVGSGRLGAMVFGGVAEERIALNEETIWAGPPVPQTPPTAADALQEARRLVFAGEYAKAEVLLSERVMVPRISPRSYQPLGDLLLRFSNAGERTAYRHELDLRTAVATTTYRIGETDYRREVFASAPDRVIAVRVTADGPDAIDCDIALDRADAEVAAIGANKLAIYGVARHGDTQLGVRFRGELAVACEGGESVAAEGGIRVRGARAFTVLVAAATDYNRDALESPLQHDLADVCAKELEAASAHGIAELRERSIASHREFFDRVEIDLGSGVDLPTAERIERIKAGEADADLAALYFQYGRYLLICSSRPGDLPANLQGLWNPHMEAPWNSDYHVNINLQMNYWPAEVANLSECHLPLLEYVEGLIPSGRQTAQALGARGFCGGHVSDAWRFTAPNGRPLWGMWVIGPAWCTQHLMEHYRYSGDVAFLQDRAFPVLRESSLFFLDWLVEDPETKLLVSGPSTSPENVFIAPNGDQASVSMGCAMDQQVIWDVFTNTLEAADKLGVEDDLVRQVRAARERLAPSRIGDDGRVLEWSRPFKERDAGHRHVSHLFALHPGRQFSYESTPDMMRAAQQTLEYRLANGGGHTGWSRAWIINFWARLRDAEKAHENVVALFAKSTLPNLFDTHPPFQIDGNFGGAAGIAEMLLQSHATAEGTPVIELLPSLPVAWPDGSVEGLRARGGFELDFAWRGGRITAGSIASTTGGRCVLVHGDRRVEFDTRAGGVTRLADAFGAGG